MARQKPLSLRFATRPLWRDFQQALGVNETGAAIVLDLSNCNAEISYSRSFIHYDAPHRYKNDLYTAKRVIGQVDYLDNLGLIHHDRRRPGQRGWQSSIVATDELKKMAADIVNRRPLSIRKPKEGIILKDAEGRLVDYKDTRATNKARRNLAQINEALDSVKMADEARAPLVRIYNRNFERGGRFYAMGASFQNMKKELRRQLQINGEPLVEIDYKTLHPALLYADAGATMPADCYDLPGWPRALVKRALLTLINAPNRQSALLSVANSEQMAEFLKTSHQSASEAAQRLFNSLAELHAPIARYFHSDAGAALMAKDAYMAERVMLLLLKRGLVVLPIHDSFLVQESQADALEAAMMEAAEALGLDSVELTRK